MSEAISDLHTCWRLLQAINDLIGGLEQSRDDGRALQVCLTLSHSVV